MEKSSMSIIFSMAIISIAIGLLLLFAPFFRENANKIVQENRESLTATLNETHNESDIAEPRTVENPIQRTVHENTIEESQIRVEKEGIYSEGIVYGGLIIGFIIIVGVFYIYVHKKINGLETKIDKCINKIKGVKLNK